jgi:hypothetical protein
MRGFRHGNCLEKIGHPPSTITGAGRQPPDDQAEMSLD